MTTLKSKKIDIGSRADIICKIMFLLAAKKISFLEGWVIKLRQTSERAQYMCRRR